MNCNNYKTKFCLQFNPRCTHMSYVTRRWLKTPPGKLKSTCYSMQNSPLYPSPNILSKSKSYVTSSKSTKSSFWLGMIPKPLRKSDNRTRAQPTARVTKWNPSTFFIVFLLLIGSNAIQMITLKKDHATYIRRANVKIETLKEIIEKIKNGERVDVESLLGTGINEKEAEWEELLQDIANGECEQDPPHQSNPENVKNMPDTNSNVRKSNTPIRSQPSNIHKTGAPPGFF